MFPNTITHRTDDDVELHVDLDAHGLTIRIGNRYCVVLDTADGVKLYLHDAIEPESECIEIAKLDEIFAATGTAAG
jgi:hypothetical protein